MYIYENMGGTYYEPDGTQHSRKAPFLMLVTAKPDNGNEFTTERLPIKGIVRQVALTQLGQWMMGKVRVYASWYTVSGAYGADGLTKDIALSDYNRIPRYAVLPKELYDAWNTGGGWNSSGTEAPVMQQWAIWLHKHADTDLHAKKIASQWYYGQNDIMYQLVSTGYVSTNTLIAARNAWCDTRKENRDLLWLVTYITNRLENKRITVKYWNSLNW